MKIKNSAVFILLALTLGSVLAACNTSQKDNKSQNISGKNGENKMNSIFSEIEFQKLPKMKVAMRTVVSKEPESDVINYMDNWAKENGLLDIKDYLPRKFGWDYPNLTQEQKSKNLRGYVYCYTLPENFTPKNEGAEILYIEADEYAIIRITEPFNNPFETIPNAWKKLDNYVQNSEYKPRHWNNRYAMEEVIEINGITYMDIYYPVK